MAHYRSSAGAGEFGAMGSAVAIRLALFYAAVFLFVGVALPFWPVWLTAKGLSATEIGLTITAGA